MEKTGNVESIEQPPSEVRTVPPKGNLLSHELCQPPSVKEKVRGGQSPKFRVTLKSAQQEFEMSDWSSLNSNSEANDLEDKETCSQRFVLLAPKQLNESFNSYSVLSKNPSSLQTPELSLKRSSNPEKQYRESIFFSKVEDPTSVH